jgi:hypothetical protein
MTFPFLALFFEFAFGFETYRYIWAFHVDMSLGIRDADTMQAAWRFFSRGFFMFCLWLIPVRALG